MNAILTKFVPPTATHCARVKAMLVGDTVVWMWAENLDIHGNHVAAAKHLLVKLGVDFPFITGMLPNGCYAHIELRPLRMEVSP